MNCEKAQEYIDSYINHTLSNRELEDFIKHIKSCPHCFDELETYFIVDIAIKYLDEEKEESYNIPQLLEDDLKKRTVRLRKKKWKMRLVLLLSGIVLGVICIGSLVWLEYITF